MAGDFFDVGQNQIGALVGGKAARKTDGERIGTEHAFQLLQHLARFFAARGLLDGAAAHKFDHPRFQVEMSLPELAVVDVVDAFPDLGLAAAQMPSRAEMAIVEAKHLRGQPGRDMDAVGNVSDGNRVFRFARESPVHMARETSPCREETALARRESFRPSTVMQKRSSLSGFSRPSAMKAFLGKTESLAQRSEVLFDQIGIEAIMAGGHGSVGGEDHFPGNPRHGLLEADALFFHALANRFQDRKSAVPFVQVKNTRGDAKRFQSAQSTHAQKQFLVHANAAIAAVQTRGHLAVFGGIAFHVRVEEKQIAAAHFHAPDFGVDRTMAGINLHHDRSAVFSDGRFHGKLVDIGLEVLFVLPAVAIETLAEISLAIKQAHADQRDAEIGGALDVIAGQNSKSSRIDGERFMHAKFGGEISHGTGPQHTGVARTPGALRILVLAQAAIGVVDPAVQGEFGGARFEFGERILVQQQRLDCD